MRVFGGNNMKSGNYTADKIYLIEFIKEAHAFALVADNRGLKEITELMRSRRLFLIGTPRRASVTYLPHVAKRSDHNEDGDKK